MQTPPTVSVMMPVYNTARYIAPVLDSLLRQTFSDFEIVIIDDGSSDGSQDILRTFATRDSRIRLTCRENRGAVHTRNEILSQCRGTFLAVNDADDLSLPERLKQQVEFLEQNPDVACVGGAFDLIDAAGRRLTTLHPPQDDATIQTLLLAGHCSICHSAGMMRRNAVEQIGGYRQAFSFSHDLDLWLRLGELGKLVNLRDTVIQFRLHQSSISETKRHEQRAFAQRACEEAWARRGITDAHFEAEEPWRPGKDRASRHQYAMKYGWWALGNGERKTAFVYGAKAIAAQPTQVDGWKLVARSIKPRRSQRVSMGVR